MRLFYIFLLFIAQFLSAQVVTWSPLFPTADDTVTIVYNAAEGNRELLNVAPIWTHTGVITDKSTKPSDWRYVKTEWSQNTPETRMQSAGDNLWSISFHIRSYYRLPAGER